MKIRLTIGGKTVTAALADNATARDFLSLLPMTLALEDYAATERISYLPRKLATAGAPAGSDPSPATSRTTLPAEISPSSTRMPLMRQALSARWDR